MLKLGALNLTKHVGPKHSATVIFFHGSGDTGENLQVWVHMLSKAFEFSHIKIMYPTAPLQSYHPAAGGMSTVWFDRVAINPKVPEKENSLKNLEYLIKDLLKQENNLGIPSRRIIVGGFSMGGSVAFHTGYRWDKNVAGVFAISSFLNENSAVYKELTNNHHNMPPLLQIHGDYDPLVNLEWGKTTFNNLQNLGVQGSFYTMPKLGHSMNRDGLQLLKQFILKVLPETDRHTT